MFDRGVGLALTYHAYLLPVNSSCLFKKKETDVVPCHVFYSQSYNADMGCAAVENYHEREADHKGE